MGKVIILLKLTFYPLPLPVNCETLSAKNKEKDRVLSLEEKIYMLNTEITALRYFTIEQQLLVKTMAKDKLTDLYVCDSNKFSDEIT